MLRVSGSKSLAVVDASSGVNLEAAPPPGLGVFAGLATGAKRCLTSALERIIEPSGPAAQRPSGMTCARREAGAQRPAPSTGSSRKSDPRPGHRRARLFCLLPALALLLGAFSPFAAAPAAADVLVSNLGQATHGPLRFREDIPGIGFRSASYAQGFTTGSFSDGYLLSGVEVPTTLGRLDAANLASYRAELWSSDGNGAPASRLASLEAPASVSPGNYVVVAFTAPTNTRLAANTSYHVVVYRTDTAQNAIASTTSSNEDAGGETGWSIADKLRYVNLAPPSGTWSTFDGAFRIRVNGWRAGAAVPAPTGLTVTADEFGALDVSWTGPAGTVTGYDVHYTSSTTVARDAAAGSDAAAGWVSVSRTGAVTSQTISGLTNSTFYRVRVRARNGPWAFGAGTTRAAAAVTYNLWSAKLTVKDLSGGLEGCNTDITGPANACSTTATLTEDEFSVGGRNYQIITIRANKWGLRVRFDAEPNDAFGAYKLCVAGRAYSLSDVSQVSGEQEYELAKFFSPADNDFAWSPGDVVPLSIGLGSDCMTPPPPDAPTDLAATVAEGPRLDLAWTAPSGLVTGYDVHYTSASSDDVEPEAEASGRDPSTAWVDAYHSGRSASHSISGAGLSRGATYRVRVRAMNSSGSSDWLHGEKEVPASAPGKPTHLSVLSIRNGLSLSWLAPSDKGGAASVTYRAHITFSQTVADDAPVGTDLTDTAAITRVSRRPRSITPVLAITLLTGCGCRRATRSAPAAGRSAGARRRRRRGRN